MSYESENPWFLTLKPPTRWTTSQSIKTEMFSSASWAASLWIYELGTFSLMSSSSSNRFEHHCAVIAQSFRESLFMWILHFLVECKNYWIFLYVLPISNDLNDILLVPWPSWHHSYYSFNFNICQPLQNYHNVITFFPVRSLTIKLTIFECMSRFLMQNGQFSKLFLLI